MPSLSKRILAILVAVFGLLLGAISPAGSQTDDEVPGSEADVPDPDIGPAVDTTETHQDALKVDASRIAEGSNLSEDVAHGQLAYQEEVIDFIGELNPGFIATRFASGRFNWSDGRPSFELFVKGGTPNDVRRKINNEAPEGFVVVDGRDLNLREMQQLDRRIAGAVQKATGGQVISRVDVVTQSVEIEFAVPAAREAFGSSRVRTEIDGVLSRDPLADVAAKLGRIEYLEHPPGTELVELTHGYGGAWMRNSGRACTTAFVVRKWSTWEEGVLTAAHCESVFNMEQNDSSGNSVAVFSSPFRSEHIGFRGDIEWHATSHDDYPKFWENRSSLRNVHGRMKKIDTYVNMWVCHYGRSYDQFDPEFNPNPGQAQCAQVNTVTASWTLNVAGHGWVTASDLIGINKTAIACPQGNSGGPLYIGAWAVGILSASYTQQCMFSKVENAEIHFGVFVQTS